MKSLLLLLGLFLTLPAYAGECTDYKALFAQQAVERLPEQATVIEIRPFKNDTGLKGDEWLSIGIPHLLKRYLATTSGLGVLKEPAKGAQYKIEGLFQHTQEWLRIFVQLKNAQDKMIAQFPVETPFPLHKQFFTGLKEAALKILAKLEKEADPASLNKIENETNRVAAFQNYIKGLMALETYQYNQIEVALIWFQEARREDLQFVGAYQGFLEAYGFLILYHKQKGENVQPYIEAIQNTLTEMAKRTNQKIEAAGYPVLKAHVHYVSGQRALAQNMPATAAKEFQAALELVPIDAAAAYALSQSYAKLGQKELAAKYQKHAEALNPCR